jgi:hypothetical protein
VGMVVSLVRRAVCIRMQDMLMIIKSVLGVAGFLILIAPFMDSMKNSRIKKTMDNHPVIFVLAIFITEGLIAFL